MISKIPQVYSAIRTINIPRMINHHEADVPISRPASEAITPNAVNVTAAPAAKVTDNRKALPVSRRPVPPTYPTTRGIPESAHGVKEVSTPAARAISGASQPLVEIRRDKLSRISVTCQPPLPCLPVLTASALWSARLHVW